MLSLTETALPTSPDTRIVAITRNSRWTIVDDLFMREPLRGPREPLFTIDGTGQDDIWHTHQGVWVGFDGTGEQYVRVLPAGRPADFNGLVSSTVVDLTVEEIGRV